jgi:hypothetical protein
MEKQKFLRGLVQVGPLWYLLTLVHIFFSRSAYPFELEFMEGGSLLHILRLEQGLPLYAAPSLEYAPFIYPPFYYYVVFIIAKITGLEWFLPLRLTSILATTGTTILISGIVYKQTKSLYWASLAAGAFLATFPAGGAWFDIARVDMMFVFLLILAVFALTSSENLPAKLFAGIFLGLAFYTKQTALAYGVFFIAGLWIIQGWKAATLTGLSFALISIGSFSIENYFSDGWYSYYLFTLPRNHSLYSPLWQFALAHAYNILSPLFLFTLVGGWGIYIKTKNLCHKTRLTLVCIVGLVTLSGASSMNFGAYFNNYIPAFTGLVLLFGLGGFWLEKRLLNSIHRNKIFILYTICLLQFGLLPYNINEQIPTDEDRRAGENLVNIISRLDGDVFMPYNAYMPILAGKPAYAHIITLLEIEGHFGHAQDSQWLIIEKQFEDFVQNKKFSAIILNHEHALWETIPNTYSLTPLEYPSEKTFFPVTGTETRPLELWLPSP